jgi:hypothetical protein
MHFVSKIRRKRNIRFGKSKYEVTLSDLTSGLIIWDFYEWTEEQVCRMKNMNGSTEQRRNLWYSFSVFLAFIDLAGLFSCSYELVYCSP